ncbi:MAG TPA: shikimate kinase [Phototrophicaceae bacterium]|jgi:shikimate kinase|nr:shikimate kinase [Phototrophicaceae bacterium]
MTDQKRNLVLTGFMGTGKTTVGTLVAGLLDMTFVDSDQEIIARTGMPIPEMFQKFGEEGFRRVETVMCKWLASRADVVIATGGGMLVNVHNLVVMRASGLVVCLTASPDAIRERLETASEFSGRPLATRWEELLEKRHSAYAIIPNHIDTTGKTPDQVAAEVVALWQSSR